MTTMTRSEDVRSAPTLIPIWLRYAITVVVVLATLFLLLYRLNQFPVPWYDEGSHLHVAKNYALYGVYADSSSEGYRPFGPAIGVGPTVLLPIAAVFKIAGVSIPAARLVIVAYSLITLLGIFFLVRHFVFYNYALLAVVLLLLLPTIRYIYYSRTVVGEVPGLAFLIVGLWLWLRPAGHKMGWLVVVGILMGLASITKNQYAFFILPSLLLCWIVNIVWYREKGHLYYIIPGVIAGIMFAAWTYLTIIKLGSGDNFSENLATLREAGAGALVVLTRDSLTQVFRILTDSGLYGILFIPAFIYGIIVSLPRNAAGRQYGIVMVFFAVSTAFFVMSLGWDRYAFAPATLAVLFVVILIRDMTQAFKFDWKGWRSALGTQSPVPARAAFCVVIGWLFVTVLVPGFLHTTEVMRQGNTNAYAVSDWITANVPQDAVIESWEQELGVLTDSRIHYPPQLILAKAVAAIWQGAPPASESYDFRDYGTPDYVVVGAFAVYTGIYPNERLTNYKLIENIGDYNVYQRQNE
ncbi:MAG: glycosyltransferase family 39 protein [Anaerolineae bacterium]